MLIEVHGAGFHNRGAQLMLRTVLDRVGERFPDARFCTEPILSDFQQRASYGLLTLAPRMPMASAGKTKLLMRFGDLASGFIPASEAKRYGVARRKDVRAFIDISGYRYGDKWPADKIARSALRVRSVARRGLPAVFMPQMFGPFDKPGVADAFRPILESARLLYARDQTSYECLKRLGGDREIDLAPDITIFAGPKPPTRAPEEPFACLVPNVQMINKGKHWAADYVDRMVSAGESIRAAGVAPRVLIHDSGAEDGGLAAEIGERLGLPADDLLREDDPQRIKGLVAQARLLVGSRFHAVVASLSVGTPAITLGWAHKYEALMSDFGVAEYAHQHEQGPEWLRDAIGRLLSDEEGDAVCARLAERKEAMREKNEQMWDRVFETLAS